jgi:hypothetical protein
VLCGRWEGEDYASDDGMCGGGCGRFGQQQSP